jgi:hypothetical protein
MQQPQELILFGFSDLEIVEGRGEVLNEGIELAVGHSHVGIRLRHGAPGVGARSTGRRTQLIYEFFCQPVQVGPGEFLIDAVVSSRAIFKGPGDRRDGIDSTKAPLEGSRRHIAFLVDDCPRARAGQEPGLAGTQPPEQEYRPSRLPGQEPRQNPSETWIASKMEKQERASRNSLIAWS